MWLVQGLRGKLQETLEFRIRNQGFDVDGCLRLWGDYTQKELTFYRKMRVIRKKRCLLENFPEHRKVSKENEEQEEKGGGREG